MDESVKELQKQLTWEFPHIAKEAPDQTKEAAEYCEGYKAFLNKAKTEREFVAEAVRILSENGYQEYEIGKKYETGDKVYFINRKKGPDYDYLRLQAIRGGHPIKHCPHRLPAP